MFLFHFVFRWYPFFDDRFVSPDTHQFTCVDYTVDEETGAATLTLDDESTDTKVPDELVEELNARIAANADREEKVPIHLLVNKTQALVLEIIPAPPEPEKPAEEEQEAPADE